MIEVPLRLRPGPAASAAAADAWYVSGDGAAAWLAELESWHGRLAELMLYVLPRSTRDRAPIGVLIVPPAPKVDRRGIADPEPIGPRRLGRAQPYMRRAGKLFLPMSGRLAPNLPDSLLADALVGEILVLHPIAGLVGFSAADALRVSDLIEPPKLAGGSWDRARRCPTLPDLLSIESAPLTVETLLRSAADDIGSSTSPLLKRNEERPAESKPPGLAERAKHGVEHGLAQVVNFFASGKPPSQKRSRWFESLARWAATSLRAPPPGLEKQRWQELERLFRMLQSDPDKALKYALPLAGDDSGRGVAAPGSALPPRGTDFNLNKVFGGGEPVDAWKIAKDQERKLREQYQRLAEREAALGRHRRAAYIYAQLLGDFATAAAKLEAGRHFQEAAILYRDKLRNLSQGAACFMKAGLFNDAVVIYESLHQFETVGDLWRDLNRPDDAAAAYRRAVERYLTDSNPIAAAQALEVKLDDGDAALDVLKNAWPNSPAATLALKAELALLGRLGRHPQAAARLESVLAAEVKSERLVSIAEASTEVVEHYPDQMVRERAANTAVLAIGRGLTSAPQRVTMKATALMPRLFPGDSLVARDVSRFNEQRRSPAQPIAGKKPRVVLVKEFRLPGVGAGSTSPFKMDSVQTAVSAGNSFLVAGTQASGVAAIRGSWNGRTQSASWYLDSLSFKHIVLSINRYDTSTILLAIAYKRPLPMQSLPADDQLPPASIGAGATPGNLRTATFLGDGQLWTLTWDSDGLNVSLGDFRKGTWQTRALVTNDSDKLPISQNPFSICTSINNKVFFSFDEVIMSVENGAHCLGHATPFHMGAEIAQIDSMQIGNSILVAASSEGGVVVVQYDDGSEGTQIYVSEHLDSARVAFITGERLICATAETGKVFNVRPSGVRFNLHFDGLGEPVAAVVPAGAPESFAVFGVDGLVRVYKISR